MEPDLVFSRFYEALASSLPFIGHMTSLLQGPFKVILIKEKNEIKIVISRRDAFPFRLCIDIYNCGVPFH